MQVLTRDAKALYEICVDTVQYEEFFKGDIVLLLLTQSDYTCRLK